MEYAGWYGLAILLSLGLFGCARPPGPVGGDDVDRYIDGEMRQRRIPGVAVGVVRAGEIVKLAAYGIATLDHDVPVTPRTVFSIASVDKQSTRSLTRSLWASLHVSPATR